jgi:hypothetical protein
VAFTVISPGAQATYSTADLNGTWSYHGLVAADSPQTPNWYRQDMAFDNGSMTFSNYADSMGQTRSTSTINGAALSSDGTFTFSGDSSLNGSVSRAKNFMVVTVGTAANKGDLGISLKKSGTFTTADLAGTWYMHYLIVGDGTNANGWAHATLSISASGVGTMTQTGRSDGAALGTDSVTYSVASDGTVTNPQSSFNGIMSSDKSVVVFTVTNGTNNSSGLGIFVKAGATFTQADLAGTWTWHALGAKDGANAWLYGNMTLDSVGNMAFTNATKSSGTITNLISGPGWLISSNGVFSFSEGTHGIVSPNKEIMVMTTTDYDYFSGASSLWIGLKR